MYNNCRYSYINELHSAQHQENFWPFSDPTPGPQGVPGPMGAKGDTPTDDQIKNLIKNVISNSSPEQLANIRGPKGDTPTEAQLRTMFGTTFKGDRGEKGDTGNPPSDEQVKTLIKNVITTSTPDQLVNIKGPKGDAPSSAEITAAVRNVITTGTPEQLANIKGPRGETGVAGRTPTDAEISTLFNKILNGNPGTDNKPTTTVNVATAMAFRPVAFGAPISNPTFNNGIIYNDAGTKQFTLLGFSDGDSTKKMQVRVRDDLTVDGFQIFGKSNWDNVSNNKIYDYKKSYITNDAGSRNALMITGSDQGASPGYGTRNINMYDNVTVAGKINIDGAGVNSKTTYALKVTPGLSTSMSSVYFPPMNVANAIPNNNTQGLIINDSAVVNGLAIYGSNNGTAHPTFGSNRPVVTVKDSNLYVDGSQVVESNLTVNKDLTVKDGDLTVRNMKINSDARLKENIIPINQQNALNKLMQLRGVNYNMKTDKKQKRYGFIAQDVEKILPAIVGENPQNKYKSLNYTDLIPLIVEAIKQLKNDVDTKARY